MFRSRITASKSLSIYSNTRCKLLLWGYTSISSMMFGSCNSFNSLISLKAVTFTPSLSFPNLIFLIATVLFVCRNLPRFDQWHWSVIYVAWRTMRRRTFTDFVLLNPRIPASETDYLNRWHSINTLTTAVGKYKFNTQLSGLSRYNGQWLSNATMTRQWLSNATCMELSFRNLMFSRAERPDDLI